MFSKVYENFVQEVDAIDNGINQTDSEPRYLSIYVYIHVYMYIYRNLVRLWYVIIHY